MLDRVVYVSGIHSSGKSTFIKSLCADESCIPYKREHTVNLQDTYIRAVWRLTKYYIEANEHSVLSEENRDKVVIADRCVYDNFPYVQGFFDLGWVTQEQVEQHRKIYDAMFLDDLRPQNVIFMCPPVEWVQERLTERWETKEVKWREDNFDYLHAVHSKFIEYYNSFKGNLLKLEETNLEKRVTLTKEWISSSINLF